MRIYLKTNKSKGLIPWNHQPKLVGALHKWIGANDLHDKISMYSLSWLYGGKGMGEKGLKFDYGANWFISSPNDQLIKKIIKGIQEDPSIAYGLKVEEIKIQDTPSFGSSQHFSFMNPILVKRKKEGEKKDTHFTFDDSGSNQLLTETLLNKLKKAGYSANDIQVRFDQEYTRAETRVYKYKSIDNKVNRCPVILEGDPELIAFAWDVGIGNSTGIGFGSLK